MSLLVQNSNKISIADNTSSYDAVSIGVCIYLHGMLNNPDWQPPLNSCNSATSVPEKPEIDSTGKQYCFVQQYHEVNFELNY